MDIDFSASAAGRIAQGAPIVFLLGIDCRTSPTGIKSAGYLYKTLELVGSDAAFGFIRHSTNFNEPMLLSGLTQFPPLRSRFRCGRYRYNRVLRRLRGFCEG